MCYHPNILCCQSDKIIKKDGNKGTARHRIIFSHSPEFKGYEFYINENNRLKEIYKNSEEKPIQYKLIPCGKCIACRKSETLSWATRIELETKQYKNNYFITLTYNEENLPIPDRTVNTKTGEIYYNDGTWQGTVVKEHISQFMKKLRRQFEYYYNWQGCKFFACSEYGELGNRPHYHLILINSPEIELQPIGGNTKTKHPYYTNQKIEQIWGKGFINIGKVTWDSISYVAGYSQKKLFGEKGEEIFKKQGQEPVFALMSRRPGIGRIWYEEHKDEIYYFDEIINSKGKSIKPPSYFDRLMDIGEHDVMENIKQIRQHNQEIKLKEKMRKTGLTIKEQLEVEERTAKDKQKHYNRGRIKNV